MRLTFRIAQSGRLAHSVEITSGGKVVASARSSVSVVGAKQEPANPPAELEKPAAPPGVPPGIKPAPGSAFPEIKPKTEEELDRERSEGEFPDLGPPLVDNAKELTQLHPQVSRLGRPEEQARGGARRGLLAGMPLGVVRMSADH